jgi:hypothetical protein
MRLLNAKTLQLKEFTCPEADIPPYAILSHTWSTTSEDEISLQDIRSSRAARKAGYAKIKNSCKETAKGGLEYVWVDTCCIDKSSSAELSEAINSMFRWYKNAAICFVYLTDVPFVQNGMKDMFKESRWFTRGWTLQELLAPAEMHFFQPNGSKLERNPT